MKAKNSISTVTSLLPAAEIFLTLYVEYTPHGGDVTCSGCGASYRQNH